jgi:hypothetical protein
VDTLGNGHLFSEILGHSTYLRKTFSAFLPGSSGLAIAAVDEQYCWRDDAGCCSTNGSQQLETVSTQAGLKTKVGADAQLICYHVIAGAYFLKHGYSRDSRRRINLQNTFNATKLNHKIWKRPLTSIINRGYYRLLALVNFI